MTLFPILSVTHPSLYTPLAQTEMGSSSLTKAPTPNSSSSTDLLDGLKFGQKIYFEDVGLGSPPKSSAGGVSSSLSGIKKGRGGAVQGAQPPRCQVEGCKVDLSDAKAYYSRHKVCGMHSKSPRVIVAGIEQRFCQQCSRFHQLSEFDQEKRSCRRRLAGHNERRRKPQPSSLLTSPYGRLSSPVSVFDKSGRVGGLLMEFAAYRKLNLRNALSTQRSSEQVPGNETSTLPWRSNLETPSDLFMRGSVGGISCGPRSPPGESFTGITDTSCALSLLSNQTWGPGHRAPGLGLNNLYYGGTPMTQLASSSPDAAIHQISNASWCFKGIEAGNCSHEVVPDLGLAQISQPLANQLPDEVVVPQSDRRQYMDLLEQSRVYESSQLMHWSL